VRQVQRETLANEEKFAIAPPTGLSPYGKDRSGDGSGEVLLSELGDDEIRRPEGHPGDSKAKRVAIKEADDDESEALSVREAGGARDVARPSATTGSAFGKSGGGGRALRPGPPLPRRRRPRRGSQAVTGRCSSSRRRSCTPTRRS
jgi:hypothetical protein